mmetsp:Transcript_9161/g.22459  ORF Transcript_9161/g.22459 Transcript_9161/m.22459 type:complete len:212 (+) Transcript_9161:204-839(+)
MRYESKEFIKSHRQWQESRESKESVNGESTQLNGYIGGTGQTISCVDRMLSQQKCLPKEKNVLNSDDYDARDSVKPNHSYEDFQSHIANPNNLSLPADFSKRELEQLVRIRKKPIQHKSPNFEDDTLRNTTLHEDNANEIRRQSFEVILMARNHIQKSYREKRSQSSVELDSLLLSALPKQMWFADFFHESRDAIEKTQKRISINYSRENM